MSSSIGSIDPKAPFILWDRRWKRRAIAGSGLFLCSLVVFLILWQMFFVYVGPGEYLVIIAKNGDPLPAGEILAEPGQKGVQKQVYGEGWHFVMPVVYETSVEKNTVVPAGKIGIVTAKGGKPLSPGRVLAEEGEQGIQRHVLPPGSYRLNAHGYKVDLVNATDIPPGFVGVLRRLVGSDGEGRFAEEDGEKGIRHEILQPGLYYIHPMEYEVIKAEVGIFQTTFHFDQNPAKNTAIEFPSKGGFPISMDCTIEWEVRPESMPALIAEYGSRKRIEQTVIEVQAKAIGRDRGIDYGAQDFLEGTKREKFQEDFTQELVKVCRDKNVTVHSAFIRNIVIPDEYLKPIREKQIAAEIELTNKAKEVTAQSSAKVEEEIQEVRKRVFEVQAETSRMVAEIDRAVANVETANLAEIEKMTAEYESKIATLDAERVQVMGKAQTDVTRLKETAKSSLYQLKLEVFQNDGDAYLRYTLAEHLNPKMSVRLYHSGPGTLWTNMEGKNMTMMVPTSNGPAPKQPEKATTEKASVVSKPDKQ